MPVTFDLSRVSSLAPDPASLDAGRKLASSSKWGMLGSSGAYAFGECAGSGSSPYRVCIDTSDDWTKCSCPSRKFPCKHAISLMIRVGSRPAEFGVTALPDWAADWVSRRRNASAVAPTVAKAAQSAPPVVSRPPAAQGTEADVIEVAEEEAPAVDADALAKAEATRERTRLAREASVADGLDGLDQWILDRLSRGIAAFENSAEADCTMISRRLTDAKAGGLAQRVNEMRARFATLPRGVRNEFAIRELGTLHLIAEAYRKQDSLSYGLRQDVRRVVGWDLKKDDLLSDPATRRVSGRFVVSGVTDTLQADGLRRSETWFSRLDGTTDDVRFVLLQDFIHSASRGSATPFVPGEAFHADFAMYPSAAPLRAVMIDHDPSTSDAVDLSRVATPLPEALDGFDRIVARLPFIERAPIAASAVHLEEQDRGTLWVVGDGACIPVHPDKSESYRCLGGMTFDTVGLWDGMEFRPLHAVSPLGHWHGSKS